MKLFRVFLIVTFLVLAFVANAEPFNSSKEQYEYAKSITVWIDILEQTHSYEGIVSYENYSLGTGVIIKQTVVTYVLTCNHVIANSYEDGFVLKVRTKENQLVDAFVISRDEENDLALVMVMDVLPNYSCVRGLGQPEVTDKLFTIGNGLGYMDTYGEGLLVGKDHDGNYLMAIPSIFGDSGSGVYDSEGNLVAILNKLYSGANTPDFTTGVGIRVEAIREFLKGLL